MEKNNETGIALLVGLLVMSLALVVVVQIVGNVAIPDVEISSGEESSSRAFSAAEAGIERVLLENIGTTTGNTELGNNSSFNAEIDAAGSGSAFNYPKKLLNGESATFWLAGHDTNDNLSCSGVTCYAGSTFTLYWGEDNISQRTAIEMTLYYDPAGPANFSSGNYSNVEVFRRAFDANTTRTTQNSFTEVSSCSSGCTLTDSLQSRTYEFSSGSVLLPSCNLGQTYCRIMVRVRSLYNSNTNPVPVGIRAQSTYSLPDQVKKATSVGQAGTSNDRAVRRIEAYQSYPEPLSIFDGALISPINPIEKN